MPDSEEVTQVSDRVGRATLASVPGSALGRAELLALLARPEAERLRFVRTIAKGGMGRIDLAVDDALRRSVAVKVLHPQLREDPMLVELFLREAQITSRLQHPGIVPVHALSVDPDGQLRFTMRLVEGETLKQRIEALPAGPLDHDGLLDLIDILIKVCDALSLAHSRQIVHCDVKSENIMIGQFGEVYLMDWGVSQPAAGTEGTPASQPAGAGAAPGEGSARLPEGTVVGTPGYMAPEQALGRTGMLGPWTDVFCVGGTLYEILARKAPYAGTRFPQIEERSRRRDIPRLAAEAGPRGLRRIVERAMAPEPPDRYPSADALKEDLVSFTRGGGALPREVFAAGAAIIEEGAPGDTAYIIESGRCEARKTIDGEQVPIREMRPGEVFGETAILSPGPRTASVIALEDTTVQVIHADTLEDHMDMLPLSIGAFVRALAQRFREVDSELRVGGRV